MDKDKLLEKIIKKAEKNGFSLNNYINNLEMVAYSRMPYIETLLIDNEYYKLIFNHDFAKAFWTEKNVCEYCGSDDFSINDDGILLLNWCSRCMNHVNLKMVWQYHLQQLVISEEPLKYLEEHLED